MTRSVPWFLVFFVIGVLSGAALILVVPPVLDPENSVGFSAPALLFVLFAVSMFTAWRVRPAVGRPDREPELGGD
jgi:DMSO/TMAO reductase YedYZ heme-binding membrane subunit